MQARRVAAEIQPIDAAANAAAPVYVKPRPTIADKADAMIIRYRERQAAAANNRPIAEIMPAAEGPVKIQ